MKDRSYNQYCGLAYAFDIVGERWTLFYTLEKTLLELGKWGSQFVPASAEGAAILPVGSYALTLKTFFRPELAQDTPAIKVITRYDQLLGFIEPQVAAQLVPQWAADSLPILAVVVEQLSSSRAYPHGMVKVKFTIFIKKINVAQPHDWSDLYFSAPDIIDRLMA